MSFIKTKLIFRRALVTVGLLIGLSSSAQAVSLGVDMDGTSYTLRTSTNWTLGYEFSLSSTANVSGLGFWDQNDSFGTTTVGLWRADGTLLGTVNTGLSSVRKIDTAGGVGAWYFMDFVATLGAGNYVVGSHGISGMEYAHNGSIVTSVLTYLDAREQSGGIFQFPTTENGNPNAFFGGNIEFEGASSVVPVPAALPLFGTGLALMGFLGWRRKRKLA